MNKRVGGRWKDQSPTIEFKRTGQGRPVQPNRVVPVDHKLPVAATGQHRTFGRTRLMAKKAAAKKPAAAKKAAPAKKAAAKKAAKKK